MEATKRNGTRGSPRHFDQQDDRGVLGTVHHGKKNVELGRAR
jgi:hypothetical protein